MSNIIPFEQSNNLPAHFAGAAGCMSLNDQAEEFASVKFPVISIKGARFHVKRDDELTLLLRPKVNATDPDEPASYIEVAILNLQRSKTFYIDGYVEGAAEKPDCDSSDGVTPDSNIATPQCSTCALCPNNAWGSGTNDKGEATKGKACSDVQRIAVAAVSNLDDPMLMRVPPASLKNLAEMSKQLSKKNIPLNGVVTRISFDPTSASPVMVFKAVGYLDAAGWEKSKSMQNDDLVLAIVGKSVRGVDALGAAPSHMVESKPEVKAEAKVVEAAKPAVDPEAAKKKAAADAKAKKLAAAKAALAAAEAEDGEDAATAEPAAQPKATATTSASFDDELNALLA